jgi:hypothetical protein
MAAKLGQLETGRTFRNAACLRYRIETACICAKIRCEVYVGNQHLRTWVQERAGTRIHGATQQAPLHLFHAYEQAALLPLPETPFTLLEIHPVTVHPDCHVRIDKSYYSVPHIYQGHTLTIRGKVIANPAAERRPAAIRQSCRLKIHRRIRQGKLAFKRQHATIERH